MSENLGEKVIKNGVILPYQKFAKFALLDENNEAILGQKSAFKKPVILDEKVVFLGFFSAHHGHFITEEIARLWWILEHDISGLKFAYSRLKSVEFSVFEAYILEMFGLNSENLVPVIKPTKFKEIILPDESFFNENGLEKHRKMIDFITSHITPNKKFKKIYLSRRKFAKANSLEFGEEFFEEIYAKQGFHIAYPETLTPKEQLELMGGGNHFAALGGTISHNTLFAPYESELTIISKAKSTPDFSRIQPRVDRIKKLKVNYIKSYANLSGIEGGRGPFLMLPRGENLNESLLKRYESVISSYMAKYTHDLLKGKLYSPFAQNERKEDILEHTRRFENEIKNIDERLTSALKRDFARLNFWAKFYLKSRFCAWWAYRAVNFPRIFIRETKRILAQISKFWHKF